MIGYLWIWQTYNLTTRIFATHAEALCYLNMMGGCTKSEMQYAKRGETMNNEWLGPADVETYRITKLSLHELLPNIVEENHAAHVRAMIRDCDYVIEWMETGRRPGNKRGVERLAAYQREIPFELMERYAKPPERIVLESEFDWVRMEYILNMLTERERTCYELHIGGMWTEREIAQQLGIKRTTVQEFLKRANMKVKKYKTAPVPLRLLDLDVV
jgi:RNA polymerase sigma-70 factor (ECF subfamily)